jgi:Asp-tRNA(Asn)/Glu-tRNA(Gln) amidotransferase A subunit family amidase
MSVLVRSGRSEATSRSGAAIATHRLALTDDAGGRFVTTRWWPGVGVVGGWRSVMRVPGCPAISVPVGFNDLGLPMGLQIIAPHQADTACQQLARDYE